MNELLLVVDTATPAGSVALSRGTTLLGEIALNLRKTHTDRLLVIVQQLLQDAGLAVGQLDAFGVVLGPGSFTGLRVGVATVKGLALATGKPVVGVSSLATLAMQVPFSAFPVCALLDARKSEVYAGLFGWKDDRLEPLGEESVLPPSRLLESLDLDQDLVFVGDGALAYRDLIVERLGSRAHFAPWPLHMPRASSAAVLALDGLRRQQAIPLEALTPAYIRPSEAEVMWASRQG
ncbi:tRNA (adenosine(37)-N6)-threonylcarbamoyltransferase complex dimerization subunit type 1 TsaB [Trichloromonas sp.]|uniref:tRNA (adenosine(37)-N6)-threonylcarbamoyltransferase complex dimerization subunit type 1 TsaB n=1 Tax=Trichloromonas sp. TaxID=3069249 RepID=UPI003D81C2B5